MTELTTYRLPCRAEPEAWFPIDEDGPMAVRARAGCRACPARDACLERAFALGADAGIWGGLSTAERRALRTGSVV